VAPTRASSGLASASVARGSIGSLFSITAASLCVRGEPPSSPPFPFGGLAFDRALSAAVTLVSIPDRQQADGVVRCAGSAVGGGRQGRLRLACRSKKQWVANGKPTSSPSVLPSIPSTSEIRTCLAGGPTPDARRQAWWMVRAVKAGAPSPWQGETRVVIRRRSQATSESWPSFCRTTELLKYGGALAGARDGV
jgi:hypothetical protein